MKKLFCLVILLFIPLISFAEDKKIFVHSFNLVSFGSTEYTNETKSIYLGQENHCIIGKPYYYFFVQYFDKIDKLPYEKLHSVLISKSKIIYSNKEKPRVDIYTIIQYDPEPIFDLEVLTKQDQKYLYFIFYIPEKGLIK